MASVVFTGIIVGVFVFIILLLLSALTCYLLHEITGSWVYGIGIVALFYIFITILLILFRKSFFHKHISNFVVRLFFEQTENDEVENR